MASDGDRLAPVTWLFGSPVETHETQESAAESPSVSAPESDSVTGEFARVSNVSMNALARRGLSVAELRDNLTRRGFTDGEVDAEVARLSGVGLLDDAELARTLVRTLRDRKGLGPAALTAELKRRRLDPVVVAAALAESDDDEVARAHDLAVKRAPQLRHVDSDAARRRLGGYLLRKGYSAGVVHTVVDRVLADVRPRGPRFE